MNHGDNLAVMAETFSDLRRRATVATGHKRRALQIQLKRMESRVQSMAMHPHLEFLKLIHDVYSKKTCRTLEVNNDIIAIVIPVEIAERLRQMTSEALGSTVDGQGYEGISDLDNWMDAIERLHEETPEQ